MSYLYNHFLFVPLYNALVLVFTVFPWADAGVAVVLITILVRLVLFPLSKKAVVTQMRMQEIQPALNELKTKYKDDTQEQARQTLLIYKEKGVNPFSGIFLLLIQLPIIFALYKIFLHASFPTIDAAILYSFVHVPDQINAHFLGLIDITKKSALLAALAGAATYFQIKLSTMGAASKNGNSFGDDLAKNMQKQMKYVFPVLVFFIAYKISGVIALYWFTTNLFTIGQEIVVRRRLLQLKSPHA